MLHHEGSRSAMEKDCLCKVCCTTEMIFKSPSLRQNPMYDLLGPTIGNYTALTDRPHGRSYPPHTSLVCAVGALQFSGGSCSQIFSLPWTSHAYMHICNLSPGTSIQRHPLWTLPRGLYWDLLECYSWGTFPDSESVLFYSCSFSSPYPQASGTIKRQEPFVWCSSVVG